MHHNGRLSKKVPVQTFVAQFPTRQLVFVHLKGKQMAARLSTHGGELLLYILLSTSFFKLQHTLPSWYYSDPRGHIRRGGAQSCGQAGQDSDLRSAGLASTISCPAPGDVQEVQSWNTGPSELRKRPEGIPLIFPRKAAGAQRDEVTCPESHNCLEMYDPTE